MIWEPGEQSYGSYLPITLIVTLVGFLANGVQY